ncbi:hypothetical protein NE398_06755 [Clostridium tertium]|uniref:Uncharacterized protein n=1 Tax=Clostridium tertium TaxID=1559 RepID=A0A9X3XML2_9CLOT|nr:hypothetical protein [Clostridium tertium]MDC4239862.1 hypothetical protein [Clostridium tertium]
MDMELIKKFLIDECGYKSINDAIKNTPRINIYAFIGEVNRTIIKEDKL